MKCHWESTGNNQHLYPNKTRARREESQPYGLCAQVDMLGRNRIASIPRDHCRGASGRPLVDER